MIMLLIMSSNACSVIWGGASKIFDPPGRIASRFPAMEYSLKNLTTC